MKLYRLCRHDEVMQILDAHCFDNIGNYCRKSEKNTHVYNEDIRYLHFFKQESDLLYLNSLRGRFICVYEIPNELASKHYGVGKYRDYYTFSKLMNVDEFAIPSSLIKFDYLRSIYEISKDIDVDDMLYFNWTEMCLIPIYDKSSDLEIDN